MKIIGMAAATLLAAGTLVSIPAQAISYGTPDCESGVCVYPNVVMLAGLRDGSGGGTAVHCSGTLIYPIPENDAGYYLFLTAGHCTSKWSAGIAAGVFTSVGVSFRPVVDRKDVGDGSISMDESQFAAGGVPVTYSQIGPNPNARIPTNDYGIVRIPAGSIRALWPLAKSIPPVTLAFEADLLLDELLAQTPNPHRNMTFSAVGYGWTERMHFGSNAGGLAPPGTGLGTRRIAGTETFDNLRETLLQTSQNPALGNAGTCYGDSGGPAFYQTASGPVQVGITSSGDNVCRAMGTYARTDIGAASWFVSCVRNNPDNLVSCGF